MSNEKTKAGRAGSTYKASLAVNLPVEFSRREKWVLASCPILDVHTQGSTEEEARKNLAEALTLFLSECFEMGTLDRVLKDCGFESGTPAAEDDDEAADYLSIPIHLIVHADRHSTPPGHSYLS